MEKKTVLRRNFLKITGVALSATTLTCSGLGYAATRSPAVETPDQTYGEDNPMNNRALVTYATRAGSTVDVAAAIGETLSTHGYAVDVKPVKESPPVAGYQVVIIGSAIRMGHWLPEAVNFVETHQETLHQLTTAFFTVHMMNLGDDETSRKNRLAYLDPVREILVPQHEVFFAGKMDLAQLSFLDRLIAKAVKSTNADRRDWSAIRNWTNQIR